jgi:hypothetical protein
MLFLKRIFLLSLNSGFSFTKKIVFLIKNIKKIRVNLKCKLHVFLSTYFLCFTILLYDFSIY